MAAHPKAVCIGEIGLDFYYGKDDHAEQEELFRRQIRLANELKMPHVVVSSIYMVLQVAFSLVAIYVIPDTIVAHWIYLIVSGSLVTLGYILFMMKYYHLHEEYLFKLRVKNHGDTIDQ
jgi:hypothetical protein